MKQQTQTWIGFVIEFPTYPKQMVQGREESRRILFLCPDSEGNPTELCLALFGQRILMHRLQQDDAIEAMAGVSFMFLYADETPDALRAVVARYERLVSAPILVTRKANVVRTAKMVAGLMGIGTADQTAAGLPVSAPLEGDSENEVRPFSGEDLWNEPLPEIILTNQEGEAVHASHQMQDYRAEYTCRYVLAHFNENINRDKMAKMVNLSPGYFSNLFRSEVGMSFSDYLIQVRVENAKTLLRRFDLSVEAISKKCGFNSLAHFSRTFKDRCGQSPLKYRKSPPMVA
jgi:two-component system response regulator YesN